MTPASQIQINIFWDETKKSRLQQNIQQGAGPVSEAHFLPYFMFFFCRNGRKNRCRTNRATSQFLCYSLCSFSSFEKFKRINIVWNTFTKLVEKRQIEVVRNSPKNKMKLLLPLMFLHVESSLDCVVVSRRCPWVFSLLR